MIVFYFWALIFYFNLSVSLVWPLTLFIFTLDRQLVIFVEVKCFTIINSLYIYFRLQASLKKSSLFTHCSHFVCKLRYNNEQQTYLEDNYTCNLLMCLGPDLGIQTLHQNWRWNQSVKSWKFSQYQANYVFMCFFFFRRLRYAAFKYVIVPLSKVNMQFF